MISAGLMALGGFNGSDTTLTVEQFQQLVATGQVRYYVTSAGGQRGGPGGGPSRNNAIVQWAQHTGQVVEYGGTAYTVYDMASAATAT